MGFRVWVLRKNAFILLHIISMGLRSGVEASRRVGNGLGRRLGGGTGGSPGFYERRGCQRHDVARSKRRHQELSHVGALDKDLNRCRFSPWVSDRCFPMRCTTRIASRCRTGRESSGFVRGATIWLREWSRRGFGEVEAFCGTVRGQMPAVWILYVSNAPNPNPWSRIEEIREANELIAG